MERAGKSMGSSVRGSKNAWINPSVCQMICMTVGKSCLMVSEKIFPEYSQTSLPNIGKTHHFAYIWKMFVQ
jgi:hypothetical protein